MTRTEFSSLEKDKQIEAIKQCGTLLFIRHEGPVDIVLYQIQGFYAEVFFGGVRNRTRITSFDDTARLDVYLREISLSELDSLH